MASTTASIIAPEGLRSLPARPNLAFERKRAKDLARASQATLTQAQRQVAREYGFANWRMLVAYYTRWHQHTAMPVLGWEPGGDSERAVNAVLKEYADRRAMTEQPPDVFGTAAAIATFIPRFLGARDEDIFAAGITDAEARHVCARRIGLASWEEALARRSARDVAESPRAIAVRARQEARRLTRAAGPMRLDDFVDGESDVDRVAALLAQQPELHPAPRSGVGYDESTWRLICQAMMDSTTQAADIREICRREQIDLQSHLDFQLLGRPWGRSASFVRGLLALGADPTHTPTNGISVLAHAIALHEDGDAVDAIAASVPPDRPALWIAAGLGDVDAMRTYFDARGALTAAARRDRPDFTAMGSLKFATARPNAADRDILYETGLIATLNGRAEALEFLLERGAAIDYTPNAYTWLHIAAAEANVRAAECLLANGANPDLRVLTSWASPREFSNSQEAAGWEHPARARIRHLFAAR